MSSLNNVSIVGRVVRDIDLRYTQNNTAYSTVSLALERSYKSGNEWQKETSFVDVEFWGFLAESLKKNSGKGKMLGVSGYLVQQKWEKDGVKHSKVCVVAEKMQLIERFESASSQQNGYQQNAPQNYQNQEQIPQTQFSGDFDEDIPF